MYKTKQIKTFLILCIISLTTNVSFSMEKTCKEKIGPFDSQIKLVKIQKIPQETITKLNKQLHCNITLEKDKTSADLLLITTKKDTIYILDLHSVKTIFTFTIPSSLSKLVNLTYHSKIYAVTIQELENTLYLHIVFELPTLPLIPSNRKSFLVNIQNTSKVKREHEYACKKNTYFKHINEINTPTQKISRRDYFLKVDRIEIEITNRTSQEKIIISPKRTYFNSVCISSNSESPYLLAEADVQGKTELKLYNIKTCKAIKSNKNNKPLDLYALDNIPVEKRKEHLQHAIFTKNNKHIILLFKSYNAILDLQKIKFISRKELIPKKDAFEKKCKLFLTSDETMFGATSGKYIYLYDTPTYQTHMAIKDQEERAQYLKKAYTNFKIKCINGETVHTTKLLLFGS